MNSKTVKTGKKIIHVVQHLAPGGIESLTLEMLRFANPEDQLLIVSLEGNKKDALEIWPRLREYHKQMIFMDKAPGVQPRVVLNLLRTFQCLRPDVVHTHHLGPLIYAGVAAKLADINVHIHTEHDAWHLTNNKHKRLQRWLMKLTQPVMVADAMLVKQQLDNLFRYHRTVVIKNGIDCNKFYPASQTLARVHFDLPIDRRIIGCAGRLEKVKDQKTAIKAMKFLPEDTLLVIAGDGSQRTALTHLVQFLDLQHRVIFIGQTDQMTLFYQALDVFCMPSLMEGLPLSLLEAQACNIPVVTTDVGASSEAVCPHTGKFIKVGDVPGLAATLLQTLNQSRVKQPREFVLKNFEIRDMAKAYHTLALGDQL
ncbi:glycosyltransferase [Vibrio fluvialis]|uniref:glycosyltransferase n=1 Tax=Vibrio fluvialis TaxID=676 RepID=UPI001EEB802C|nr:glycosyltransferase [Vibrio fluvialis]EKO3390544.1 glycosyltransferase [Vibrio fluvialis]ELX7500404.1 glycosyltransferase [Vibrio fluvialis]MCG6341339.1 glycosyltransferase [Vibrio fluvialis]